jgi:hypothetical protein
VPRLFTKTRTFIAASAIFCSLLVLLVYSPWNEESETQENLRKVNADQIEKVRRELTMGGGQRTPRVAKKQLRPVPEKAGTLSPSEATRRVRKDVAELAKLFEVDPNRERTSANKNQLEASKQADLDAIESSYGVSSPTKALFDDNRRLSAIYSSIQLGNVSPDYPDGVNQTVTALVEEHESLFGLDDGDAAISDS